jgi:hypothetical protein
MKAMDDPKTKKKMLEAASSPRTVTVPPCQPPAMSILSPVDDDGRIDLVRFLAALPDTVRQRRDDIALNGATKQEDLITKLFKYVFRFCSILYISLRVVTRLPYQMMTNRCSSNRRLEFRSDELKYFAHFDNSRNYTRNLIATDGQSYTLLLLCWNPAIESPIHDHPCDGCWMRVVSGSVREKRYRKKQGESSTGYDGTSCLMCTHDATWHEGEFAYIEDSMGYHSVGNPIATNTAITMHLYCPPFQRCKIWLDERRQPTMSSVSYYSLYGHKI